MYVDPGQTFVAVNYTVTSDGALVAGVAGQRIRILALVATAAANQTSFTDGAGATLIPEVTCTKANPFILPFSEVGWGDTAVGQSLNIAITGSDSNSGTVVYAYVA